MKMFRAAFTFVCIVLIFALSGCNNPHPIQPPNSEPTGDAITITRGTVGRIGTLSIGLVKTGMSDYVDTNGLAQNGLVAWLSVSDNSDKSVTEMMVYWGQRFEFHGGTFYVAAINVSHPYPGALPGDPGGGLIRLVAISE